MSWLTSLFPKKEAKSTGLILPSEFELSKFAKLSEITTSIAEVSWKPLDISNLPTYPQYDQYSKFSCVANSMGLFDAILYSQRNPQKIKEDLKFSADFIYENRSNRPSQGMIGTNAFEITKNIGSIPYQLLPNNFLESDAVLIEGWMKDVAKVFQSQDEAILIPIKDIDTLVSVQQVTGKPIMVWFDFNWDQWAKKSPTLSGYYPQLRHSVVFIPPKGNQMTYGMFEGEKAIVIQESAGLTSTLNGKRIIKESFYKKHNLFAGYKMRFKFDVGAGEKYDGTIISLQKCLRSVGYFPMNISLVENYGPVTQRAVTNWKTANGLPSNSMLDDQTKALLRTRF